MSHSPGRVVDDLLIVLVEGPASGLPDLFARGGRTTRVSLPARRSRSEGVIGELADFCELAGPERDGNGFVKR